VILYISFALITAIALIALICPWPGAWSAPGGGAGEGTGDGSGDDASPAQRPSSQRHDPISVYKAQLGELDRDHEDGRISDQDLAAARLEIQRRILRVQSEDRANTAGSSASASAGQSAGASGGGSSFWLTAAIACVVIVGSGLFYLQWGAPDLPAQPGQRIQVMDTLLMEGGPTYREALKTINARLQETPNDLEGWEVYGRTAMAMGAFQQAIYAYRTRSKLGDERGAWKIRELQAYLGLSGGLVTPAAILITQELAGINPDHPAPYFYQGMGAMQAGDKAGAYRIWKALVDKTGEGTPWAERLAPQLRQLEVDLGLSTEAEEATAADGAAEIVPESQK